METIGQKVDRFWVSRLALPHFDTLYLPETQPHEPDRHFLDADALEMPFDTLITLFENVPSLLICNVDEKVVNCPKKIYFPRVIVSVDTAPDAVSISAPKDDAQMMMVAAISAFGGATIPLSIMNFSE
jgi:hypothetical protein